MAGGGKGNNNLDRAEACESPKVQKTAKKVDFRYSYHTHTHIKDNYMRRCIC